MYNRILLLLAIQCIASLLLPNTGMGDYQRQFYHVRHNTILLTDNHMRAVQLEFCTPGMVRIRSSWSKGRLKQSETLDGGAIPMAVSERCRVKDTNVFTVFHYDATTGYDSIKVSPHV